jgi:hypothetical protein
VTATGPGSVAATVAFVGTSSALSVHNAVTTVAAATSSNTNSTLVYRDSSGNFSAGTITGSLSGNATNVTGIVAIANGGTGQTGATAGFDALSPLTTLGDILYYNGTHNSRIALGGAHQVLHGATAAAPTYGAVDLTTEVSGNLPPANGGTGVTNSGTLTYGSNNIALTTSGNTSLTLPTSGTLQTLAGSESPTNKTFNSTSTMTGVKIASFTPDGTHTISVPTITDTLATLGATQTLTATSLTAPTLTSYVDLTEISSPSAPSSGKVRLYSKSGDNLYFQTPAGTETQVGSGSGSKNYLATGSSTAGGWAASGAGVTVTTDTTAADLPEPTVGTGIKFLGVSGSTAFGYFPFTLDPSDYNKKLSLQENQNPLSGYAASDMRIDICSCPVAWSGGSCNGGTVAQGCGTNATRLPLSTDASSISALPNLTGSYRTTFDSPGSAAKFLQVQVGLNGTNTHAIVMSSFVVGPGVVTQGAAVTEYATYTPTIVGFGSPTINGFYWKRVGSGITIHGRFTATAPTAVTATLSLPNSYTALSTLPQGYVVGRWVRPDYASTSARKGGLIYVTANSTLRFGSDDYTTGVAPLSALNGSDMVITNDTMSVEVWDLPVNELAGSGTVNVAQNDLQFLYSTGNTWGTSNSSATTTQGPGGVLFGTTTPSTSAFYYIFTLPTPLPIGATPRLEISGDQLHWFLPGGSPAANSCELLRYDGTNYIGAGVSVYSATQLAVGFGKYAYGSTGAWSAVTPLYWRVTIGLPGQATGFGAYVPGQSSGLVPAAGFPGGTTSDSNLGTISNVNLAAYYVGSFSASFTGPRSTTDTIQYVRVGNMVTWNWPSDSGASTSCSATNFGAAASIPSALRPAISLSVPIFVRDNATDASVMGIMAIGSNGNINIFKSNGTGASNFTAAVGCGWYSGSVSYTLN